MDATTNNLGERLGRNIGFQVKLGVMTIARLWRVILLAYICIAICGSILVRYTRDEQPHHLQPRWGGFNQRPTTDRCYRQERTAILLSIFLGSFGIDQFYAHHWPLAVFKLLTLGGFGLWSLVDVILWVVGGVYGTPGCPGGSTIEWQY